MDPIISIRNLYKSYGAKEVLKGINLNICPSQVIGPNGAGKSTTVKILCGLLSDYEGEVTIKGMDIRKDTLKIKGLIGYVPELAELYAVLTSKLCAPKAAAAGQTSIRNRVILLILPVSGVPHYFLFDFQWVFCIGSVFTISAALVVMNYIKRIGWDYVTEE